MRPNLKKSVILASIILILLSSLPYLIAQYLGKDTHYFSGFLINPLDGNSYLAKMRQGFEGYWSFTLPYTPNPGERSYINLYYLFLGHVARIFGQPLIFTFHFARLVMIPFLVLAVKGFYERSIQNDRAQVFALWLALFGSGLGWIILPFIPVESITSDFWVTEGFPFQTIFSSPHFTLGMALQIWLITPLEPNDSFRKTIVFRFAGALLLAIVSPFFIPAVAIVLAGMAIVEWADAQKPTAGIFHLLAIGLGAGPVLLYDLWLVNSHPVLSGWNAQNLTQSPPLWDLAISYSPPLLAAIFAVWFVAKNRRHTEIRLVVWVLAAFIMLNFPFPLQRRFISGLYIPIAGLAGVALWQAIGREARYGRIAAFLIFILAIPTNLVIFSTTIFGIQTKDPQVYLTTGEWNALGWIRGNIPDGKLFLTAPDTGLFLPAHTTGQVIYGHPFETVEAEVHKSEVIAFYSDWGDDERAGYLIENEIDYLYIGPRENLLGMGAWDDFGQVMYEAGGVTIIQIGDLE